MSKTIRLYAICSRTWPTLAKRYRASVRLRLESSSAKIDNPETEPAKMLPHHHLKQSHKRGICIIMTQ